MNTFDAIIRNILQQDPFKNEIHFLQVLETVQVTKKHKKTGEQYQIPFLTGTQNWQVLIFSLPSSFMFWSWKLITTGSWRFDIFLSGTVTAMMTLWTCSFFVCSERMGQIDIYIGIDLGILCSSEKRLWHRKCSERILACYFTISSLYTQKIIFVFCNKCKTIGSFLNSQCDIPFSKELLPSCWLSCYIYSECIQGS